VQKVGYDSNAKELHVTWHSGRTSIYEGVSEDAAERVSRSTSVGSSINSQIKPFYKHRYS